MEKKKQIIIGVSMAVVIIIVLVLCFVFGGKKNADGTGDVYVEQVDALGGGNTGVQNRYAGVVEAQESWKINLDASRTVKEIYVKEGDEIAQGDKLFAYDTSDLNSEIAQAKLEMESISNEIDDYNTQIAALQAERDAASEEAKFDYTTEIQSVQNDLKQAQFNKKSKQLEVDRLNESIQNSVVTSKMAGVVKTLNENQNAETNSTEAFMTILATGDYRIKCLINEQNIMDISEGAAVIIRSRADEAQTWTGVIAQIDKESPQAGATDVMSMDTGSSDDTTGTSKYPFYVTLDNSEGFMLGQHVTVEPDYGQGAAKDGIWLYESYLDIANDTAYVWADNGKGRIEKREVELGEYDETTQEYQIVSGLDKKDYIAWPQDGITEGLKTTKNSGQTDSK